MDEYLSESKSTEAFDANPDISTLFDIDSAQDTRLSEHRAWLKTIQRERPNPASHLRVAIYIRFFNQTRYEDYLDYHIKQYQDTMAKCPNWTLVDFYIDEGSSSPNMESAPQWSRLLSDCLKGKVDLIITQKVSNVSKKDYEMTYCARILAALRPPVGVYFVSEDIFTLASYYQNDLRDSDFFPGPDWELLPDDPNETSALLGTADELEAD